MRTNDGEAMVMLGYSHGGVVMAVTGVSNVAGVVTVAVETGDETNVSL